MARKSGKQWPEPSKVWDFALQNGVRNADGWPWILHAWMVVLREELQIGGVADAQAQVEMYRTLHQWSLYKFNGPAGNVAYNRGVPKAEIVAEWKAYEAQLTIGWPAVREQFLSLGLCAGCAGPSDTGEVLCNDCAHTYMDFID